MVVLVYLMNNQKIQILPTLQIIIDKLKIGKELDLRNVTFVCVQHLLFTTVDLINALIILGAKPSNIHITGKIYSTCPEVVEQIIKMGVIYYHNTQPKQLGRFNDYFNQDMINMWDKVSLSLHNTKSDTIIILDDGSKSIANIPKSLTEHYKVFAVEQTSSGIALIKRNNVVIPVVNVAFSAAKQLLESPMIAKAVVTKLDKFLSLHTNDCFICGVAGLGVIGRAVVQKLLSLNHKVLVYDRFEEKYDRISSVKIVASTQLLFQEADYIFGCTGEDITISLDINKIQGIKNLISCSSQDIEFLSLLKIIQTNSHDNFNVLSNINYTLNNGIIKIFRGGYPINLDNSGESVPAKDIQLTRGLLLAGIIQALFHLLQDPKPEAKQYMLHPKIQKLIVEILIENNTSSIFKGSLVSNFLNEEWIKNNSSGEYVSSDALLRNFSAQ